MSSNLQFLNFSSTYVELHAWHIEMQIFQRKMNDNSKWINQKTFHHRILRMRPKVYEQAHTTRKVTKLGDFGLCNLVSSSSTSVQFFRHCGYLTTSFYFRWRTNVTRRTQLACPSITYHRIGVQGREQIFIKQELILSGTIQDVYVWLC